MNTVHIDLAPNKKCYALLWSYGEICCGCGCCSTNKLKRAEARLEYNKACLADRENFNGWYYEDADILALQKKNIAKDIKYFAKEVKKYEDEVKRLKGENDGKDS